ncbi:carboxylesterase [Nitzschia inconspicua]|uniref:Carboxylesterase n=1 Tax=Nitzschia inconspicua TaxID=303405 RepID=A0A9K3LZY1_9STRA|nr:carboxylesterase [Nitzschia inconspicua]
MKNIFKGRFKELKAAAKNAAMGAAPMASHETKTAAMTRPSVTFQSTDLDDDEQVFAYSSTQPSMRVMQLRKSSALLKEDDEDGYSTTATTATHASGNGTEASERNITVVTIGETPLDVFLQSFRSSGSEFLSSAYVMERSIDKYGGSLSTSLPEDVFTLVDTQVCLLKEYLDATGLAGTDTGNAVVVDAFLNIFRTLYVKQKHFRDSFLKGVDSCIAASNDFLRMADKVEQMLGGLQQDYPYLTWTTTTTSHESKEMSEWDVSTELVEQEASHLMDLFQQDAVLAAQKTSLYIIESVQKSEIPNQLFTNAWEEELTHNQVARAIVRTYAEMLGKLESLISTEYLYHKVVVALVRSTVCFYIQCFVLKASKARRYLENPTKRNKTKHSFVNPPRAVMRMTHDTRVFEGFFLDIAAGNAALRKIISNELSLLKVVILECMSYAAGQNGSDSLDEFILVVHKRTGADCDVTRHFLSDIYVLLGGNKKEYRAIESKVKSMREELDRITKVEEKQVATISNGTSSDIKFHLDKMLRLVYEDRILHEKLSLCGNIMNDMHIIDPKKDQILKNSSQNIFSSHRVSKTLLLSILLSSILLLFAQAQPENYQQYQEATFADPSSSFPVRVELPGLGVVQGVRRFSEEHVVDFFGGIPYAAPPVMNLRWSPPQDVIQWHPHVLDASGFGTDCFQVVDPVMNPLAQLDQMSEDCLYLNVFRPALTPESSGELLPVMLWFHGGAFQQGGANRPEYNAKRLAHEENVIVITANYRLGALGFLVSRELGLTGNYGLMDQRAAMHFVKHNCFYFGGDPNSITLFGESAGAVMIGLHLLMNNNIEAMSDGDVDGRLFHKAILQSNPMGYQFRSPNVADFLGDALRRAVDCRDLDCMKTESVEEILRAQSSLMGIPRSVGDFFAWGPTLTTTVFTPAGHSSSSSSMRNTFTLSPSISESSRAQRDQRRSLFDPLEDEKDFWKDTSSPWTTVSPFSSTSEYRRRRRRRRKQSNPFEVNVTQPLQNLHLIPDDIPIIIGTNKNEGEMFVHGAFPITMSKAVYWMFVGALFKDSAPKVLKHYRPYVAQLEAEAAALAQQQIQEERNKQYFMEHQHELEEEYLNLLKTTTTETIGGDTFRGGSQENGFSDSNDAMNNGWWRPQLQKVRRWGNQTKERFFPALDPEEIEIRRLQREELAKQKAKEKALREAAKVAIDYRPVMARIINDYLFRCPSWHFAHLLSLQRVKRFKEKRKSREKNRIFDRQQSVSFMPKDQDNTDYQSIEFKNNVYVYRFSQPTHVPGFLECWGKSCHTAELPFVFESMDIIRSDYSTLSPIAQKEAPVPPEYPYTDLLAAYQGSMEETNQGGVGTNEQKQDTSASLTSRLSNYTSYFQRVLEHFFEDYFKEDADEEIAHDMAQRWVAFAKTGSPNYDNSKVEWVPWRFVPDDLESIDPTGTGSERSFEDYLSWDEEERQIYSVWRDIEEQAIRSIKEDENRVYSEEEQEAVVGKAYRNRALEALNMEVVEQDTLRTELKRNKKVSDEQALNRYTFSTFGRSTTANTNTTTPKGSLTENFFELKPEKMIEQIQRMAQDMGVLGRGLSGEYERLLGVGGIGGGSEGSSRIGSSFQSEHEYWDDDFFPQFLELRWPPEGRLVERDCTCDFWGRIRYRY